MKHPIAETGGLVFNGTFSGPVTWSLQAGVSPGGGMTYVLTGAVSGTWSNGVAVIGNTVQIAVTSSGAFNGTISCSNGTCLSGDTSLNQFCSGTRDPWPVRSTGLVGVAESCGAS